MTCKLENDNNGRCRKIDKKYDNPIDNLLIYFTNKLNPTYCKLNLTPNHLTTLSLVLTLLSYYLFLQKNKYLAGIVFFIGYFFDCADGCYARRYKLITKFGDYYDHFSDISKIIILFIMLYKYSISINKFYVFERFFIVNIILFLFLSVQFGCQEKIYNKSDHSPTLARLKKLCPNENMIKVTRYFGSGTYNLFISIFLMFF
jgi:phosphatidylglycerophosphate synthase